VAPLQALGSIGKKMPKRTFDKVIHHLSTYYLNVFMVLDEMIFDNGSDFKLNESTTCLIMAA
jgi:hypothetical protein